MQGRNWKIFVFVFLIGLACNFLFDPDKKGHYFEGPKVTPPPIVVPPQEVTPPSITHPVPGYQDYSEIVAQLQEWNKEAPDLTEVGTYGKSAKGVLLHYIKITNKKKQSQKPVVLVTACIHGNEPHATATLMAFFGSMLSEYGRNENITNLIDERDIYFVPVVCPDTYPSSRETSGVDPNRDFPGPHNPNKVSVPPVKALQELFLKIKPKAVISGHTFGRVFLIPYGDRQELCPDDASYQKIMSKVSELCQYRLIRVCQLYNHNIYGTEVDWYYRNGAFGVVMEMGNHQHRPSDGETLSEMKRVREGVLYFIQEAPLVSLQLP